MKKVVIVEGKHDYTRIKQVYPKLPVMISKGSAVNQEFLEQVKTLSKTHQVILFLDPDYQGEKIRKTIADFCPNVSHAFINQKDAISKNKRKIGVEHASLEVLKKALDGVLKVDYHHNITIQELFDLGLAGSKESKKKREQLCERLNIGYANAKQLVNRLNLFNISLEQVKEIQ
ncbi:MAG: ribonuclease M5 [Bacilli bacterium]|nr:ribonuclease M5 [Bacilli bacterium]